MEEFKKTQSFVKAIQAKIGLASNNNKAAVVTYGNYARDPIKCKDYTDIYKFKSAIDNLDQHPNEYTNTRDGLEKGEYLLKHHGCGKNKKATGNCHV